MSIPSPYNFVPLAEPVFPDWADKVSHDVPFSDGMSGVIELELEAETPIFVRDSSSSPNNEFSNDAGRYFIPGSSIKGAIRNVFEIMTFSKMSQLDDRRYSWRDLSNTDTYTPNFVSGHDAPPKSRAGFIQENEGKWYLIPCEFARIEQFEIGEDYGVIDTLLSARDKYNNYTTVEGHSLVRDFYITEKVGKHFLKQCGLFKRAKLEDPNNESYKKRTGTLVFTGQIGPRDRGGEGEHGKGKKHLEFVFFNEKEKNEWLEIPKEMRDTFVLNHSQDRNLANHKDELEPNKEWGIWKEKLKNGKKMPVFWLPRSTGGKQVGSFGLAMLYRLPFDKSIQELLSDAHKKEDLDMAQIVFGSLAKKGLKGRVQFSHAYAKQGAVPGSQVTEVLNSPKPTFYPNYIEQTGGQKLKIYEQGAKLSGWKRYPVHANGVKHNEAAATTGDVNTRIQTRFTPLRKGAVFTCKVRFHNLRKVELGALLSALTFHQTEQCRHSIGMAKPLGYGRVNIKIKNHALDSELIDYLHAFEHYMCVNAQSGGLWGESEQIRELFTMATPQTNDNSLRYLPLDEHAKAKNKKRSLKLYSNKDSINPVFVSSKISQQEIGAIEEERKDCAEKRKKAQEETERQNTIQRLIESIRESEVDVGKIERDFIPSWKKLQSKELAQEIFAWFGRNVKDQKTKKGSYRADYAELANFLGEKLQEPTDLADIEKPSSEPTMSKAELKKQERAKAKKLKKKKK